MSNPYINVPVLLSLYYSITAESQKRSLGMCFRSFFLQNSLRFKNVQNLTLVDICLGVSIVSKVRLAKSQLVLLPTKKTQPIVLGIS